MSSSLLALVLTSLASLPLTFAIDLLTRQIALGEHEYWLLPTPAWTLESWNETSTPGDDLFVPLTVLNLNGTASADLVSSVLEQFNQTDDVWTSHFARVISVQSPEGGDSSCGILPAQLESSYNVSTVLSVKRHTSSSGPVGPYLIHRETGDVYRAYKLYIDTSQAFIQSTYQDPEGLHHTLSGAGPSAAGLTIGVPSRLYYTRTETQPLAGYRIGIKDLFDIAGVKTSGGSRAFYEMNPPADETAHAVQLLIDAGAVVVGKNKLSEFAYAGPFVTEHIDYLLPFNPRGDGYQSPSDSSGGSGAAVASYDWLDASMGSDTGGSIRGPAANNGVHGNRPTQHAVNLTGALPLSLSMDTSGMMARDPVIWSRLNRVLYAETTRDYPSLPGAVYLDPRARVMLDRSETETPEVHDAMTTFLEALTQLLSANLTDFSIDDAWAASGPDAEDIDGVIGPVYSNLNAYEQWNEFGRDFVDRYSASHEGRFPYMVPAIRSAWLDANSTMTTETHERDLAMKKAVADWVTDEVLQPDDEACSKAVYVYFQEPDQAFYKPDVSWDIVNPYILQMIEDLHTSQQQVLELNATVACNSTLGTEETCATALQNLEEASQPLPMMPVNPMRLASIAGVPDYAMTLGSFDRGDRTFSDASLQNESLPLAVNIVAAPGCDFVILNIVEQLHDKGVVRTVKTGMHA